MQNAGSVDLAVYGNGANVIIMQLRHIDYLGSGVTRLFYCLLLTRLHDNLCFLKNPFLLLLFIIIS